MEEIKALQMARFKKVDQGDEGMVVLIGLETNKALKEEVAHLPSSDCPRC